MHHALRSIGCLAITLLVSSACDRKTEGPPAPEHENQQEASNSSPSGTHAAFNIDDPDTCATCHSAIVEEWKTSLHANAHHANDPIYGAMREFRMEREGDELATRCANCHSPRSPDEPDSAIAQTGVSCAGCHNIAAIDRGDGSIRGARAITYESDCRMRGPHDIEGNVPAPHRTGEAAPWIVDGQTLCMTCHESATTPHGLPSCTTGFEFAESETGQSCTGCHMPLVNSPSGIVSNRPTHRSHAFVGPNQLWREEASEGAAAFMATSVDLNAAINSNVLTATLRNQTAHAFPTGFPGRMAMLKVIGFDEQGEVIWSNFNQDPVTEDPDAVFNKVYVNDEGQVVMPPYATEIRRDSRLTPGELRELTWELPDSVVRVELKLLFRLLPPPAAEALGIADSELATPRVIASEQVSRN